MVESRAWQCRRKMLELLSELDSLNWWSDYCDAGDPNATRLVWDTDSGESGVEHVCEQLREITENLPAIFIAAASE